MLSASVTRRCAGLVLDKPYLLTSTLLIHILLLQLLDYDSARTKARKLVDKPSDDSGKLPLAERQAEDAREGMTNLSIVIQCIHY